MAKYRIFDKDKFTKVGNVIITDDGIASGFTTAGTSVATKFLRISKLPSNISTVKIKGRITKPPVTPACYVFSEGFSSNYAPKGYAIMAYQDNLRFYIGNGSSREYVAVSFASLLDTFFFECSDNGTQLSIKVSSDGINWIEATPVTKTLSRVQSTTLQPTIGAYSAENGENYDAFGGSIDLAQFSITVDGVEVFAGSHEITVNEQMLELIETKNRIKNAIIKQGGIITADTPFREYANEINKLKSRMFRLPTLERDGYQATVDNANLINETLVTRRVSGREEGIKYVFPYVANMADGNTYELLFRFLYLEGGQDSCFFNIFNSADYSRLWLDTYSGLRFCHESSGAFKEYRNVASVPSVGAYYDYKLRIINGSVSLYRKIPTEENYTLAGSFTLTTPSVTFDSIMFGRYNGATYSCTGAYDLTEVKLLKNGEPIMLGLKQE